MCTLFVLVLGFFFTGPSQAGLREGLAAFLDNEYGTALKELKPLAEKGNVQAQNILGKMFNTGGTDLLPDDRQAIKWFRLAARQGDAEGQLNLGQMYAGGMGVSKDIGEALEGTVMKVGDQLLHLSRITGKDFYEALVQLDKTTTVILKVR